MSTVRGGQAGALRKAIARARSADVGHTPRCRPHRDLVPHVTTKHKFSGIKSNQRLDHSAGAVHVRRRARLGRPRGHHLNSLRCGPHARPSHSPSERECHSASGLTEI